MPRFVHNLSRKFWLRIICSLLLCVCFIALGQSVPAHAASPYFLYFAAPDIPPSSCDNTQNIIQGPFSLNILGGMKYSMVVTVNGVNYPPATGTYPAASSGSGFTYLWGLGYASISYPYPVRWAFTLTAANGTPLTQSIISFNCIAPGVLANIVVTNISFTAGASGFVCPMFWDGRLNDCDPGQTVAVYCLADGSVNILAIYKSMGYDAILASPSEIAAVPKHPVVNTPIKSGNGATLYRLTSGELQVNRAEDGTGKTYRFIFNDCPKP